jgi:hypothetical protein
MSGSRFVVLVPSFEGRPHAACDEALRALERRGVEVRRVGGFSRIDFVRSLLATRALDEGFDELFWIDDDIVFRPDDVFRLRESGAPMVAGIYAKKRKRALAVYAEPGTESFTFGPGGGLAAVQFVGSGFLYTRRSVYDAIASELPVCNEGFGERVVPYFLPFVMNTERGPWYLGEDYAFCERARRAGHRIMVDTRIRLFHIGTYEFGWEDAGNAAERFESYKCMLSPPRTRI